MENKPSQPGDNEKEMAAAPEDQAVNEHQESHDELQHDVELNNESTASVKEVASASEAIAGGANRGGGSKAWIAISAILAIVLVIVLVNPPFSGSSKAVATINGDKITKDDLYNELVTAQGKTTLSDMITQKLIDQAAKDAGVTVTEDDINAEIASVTEQFGGQDQLDSALQQYGMTMDDLRKNMDTQVKVRKILEPQTKVTDDDIKKYYDENKASFATPEQVRASHILVATKEEADAIKKQLDGGADFATLASQKSTDTASAANGGDLGFFGKGQMDPAFEAAAFALDVNQVSDPVKSSYGYHIIKKTDYKPATNPTLEDKKEDIRKTLIDQQVNDLSSTWMTELRAKAKITNTLDPSQNSTGKTDSTPSAAPSADASAAPDASASPDAAASASPEAETK
ncbi:peptidylprolyl isomerase [Paenibacillus protaetiae]|uniref:Foldase protein PrsA n=1 Tax=Paenibacillus protaetiae TaxID=2509456 RepID=A0A4P6EY37_9BACL|nr:peptidylprolyl isomerase [Paenibacillus protaetiae]QAY67163.1 peptidylprolyl isomerase [Paenibacillus protaetiae]